MGHPEVRNAANPEQVKRARRKEQDREKRKRRIYAEVLSTTAGRALIWDLLTDTGVYQTPFDASGSKVYYNIGRSDFGRDLLAYLAAEHARAYLLMEQEARAFEEQEASERDAAHTRSITEERET